MSAFDRKKSVSILHGFNSRSGYYNVLDRQEEQLPRKFRYKLQASVDIYTYIKKSKLQSTFNPIGINVGSSFHLFSSFNF